MKMEPKVTGCEHNSTCVPTLDQIGKCLTALLIKFILSLNEKSSLSLKDETAILSQKRINIKFFFNNLNLDVLNLLDSKIEHNVAQIELENQSKNDKKKTDAGEPFQQISGPIKAVINCGVMDFGNLIGNIVENLKNKKGDHIITVPASDLANMLSLCCELHRGKQLNPNSLAIAIGNGEKEVSIIDQNVLDKFFNIGKK